MEHRHVTILRGTGSVRRYPIPPRLVARHPVSGLSRSGWAMSDVAAITRVLAETVRMIAGARDHHRLVLNLAVALDWLKLQVSEPLPRKPVSRDNGGRSLQLPTMIGLKTRA